MGAQSHPERAADHLAGRSAWTKGNVSLWTGSAATAPYERIPTRWPFGRPLGTYRWTLTGKGPFGAPVQVGGSATVSGTVVNVRQVPVTATITAPTSVTAGAAATITGRLVLTGTSTPVAGKTRRSGDASARRTGPRSAPERPA